MLASFNGESLISFEFVHAVVDRTLPLAVLLMSVCSHSGYENLQVLLYIIYNYQCELLFEGYNSELHVALNYSLGIKIVKIMLGAWYCLFIDLVF